MSSLYTMKHTSGKAWAIVDGIGKAGFARSKPAAEKALEETPVYLGAGIFDAFSEDWEFIPGPDDESLPFFLT